MTAILRLRISWNFLSVRFCWLLLAGPDQKTRLEVRRRRMTFYYDSGCIVSFLHVFASSVKGIPAQVIKHKYNPSYFESEGGGMKPNVLWGADPSYFNKGVYGNGLTFRTSHKWSLEELQVLMPTCIGLIVQPQINQPWKQEITVVF